MVVTSPLTGWATGGWLLSAGELDVVTGLEKVADAPAEAAAEPEEPRGMTEALDAALLAAVELLAGPDDAAATWLDDDATATTEAVVELTATTVAELAGMTEADRRATR